MKKISFFFLLFSLICFFCYRSLVNFYFEQQIKFFIQNQKQNGIFITFDKNLPTNSLFTIGQRFQNVQIKTGNNFIYLNPQIDLTISLVSPFKANLSLDGNHKINGINITSNHILSTLNLKEKSYSTTIQNIKTPFLFCDVIKLDLTYSTQQISIKNLWVQAQHMSFLLTGNIQQQNAALEATIINWKEVLQFLRNNQIISEETYSSLYWAFSLIGVQKNLIIPIKWNNHTLTVANIPILLR